MRAFKLDPKKLSKLLFLLYIVYANVASYSLFLIKGLSPVLLIGALALEIYSDDFKLKANKSFLAYIVFLIYILGSGLIVAKNYSLVISTATTFAESLVAVYLVVAYVVDDRNVNYVMNVYIIQAIFAAIIVIFNGVGAKRISIAQNINVNTIGVMLAFSIGFILYMLIEEKHQVIQLVLAIGCILLQLVGIFLTVSKKGIFATSAMIILWIITCYRFTFKKLNAIYKILLLILFVGTAIFAYKWYTSNYAYQIQILQMRMSQLYSGDSDQDRIRLFFEGFSTFLSHPIFGVGFNNARYYSFRNTYTHAFYSELFACTGIFGVLIYFYALFRPLVQIHNTVSSLARIDTQYRIRTIFILLMFYVLLLLSFAQIIFYHPTMMYLVAVFTGYGDISISGDVDEQNAN